MHSVLDFFYSIYSLYWNTLLGGLFNGIEKMLGGTFVNPWIAPAFKASISLIILFVLREFYVRISLKLNARRLENDMTGHDVREPYTVKDTSFVEELDAAQFPVHTIAQLKKDKRYDKLADIHSKLNQPAEAARWYIKDNQPQRAAEELAKAGKTLQAAKLLLRVGDCATAARFFTTVGKHKQAAAAHMKMNDIPNAGRAYVEGGYYFKGAACFQEYLNAPDVPMGKKEQAADICYHLLQKGAFSSALPIDQRNNLFKGLGKIFFAANRAALAASLFQEAGETKTASEIYKMLSAKPSPVHVQGSRPPETLP